MKLTTKRVNVQRILSMFSLFFGKFLSNVVALIVDNCLANCGMSRIANVDLSGCCSLFYNLNVENITKQKKNIVQKVVKEMPLNFFARRATLRELTNLAFLKCINSRWSPVDTMPKRYNALREHLNN